MSWGWSSSRGRVLARAGVGVLSWVIGPDLVDEAVGDGLAWEMRLRSLPARTGVYFVLGLCLLGTPYADVIRQVTLGLEGPLAAAGWAVPATTALSAVRARLGERPLESVFRRLCGAYCHGRASWSHYAGLLVVAWDGTTIAVHDSEANAAAFGRPPDGTAKGTAAAGGGRAARAGMLGTRPGRPGPQARLVILVACGTRCLLDAAFGPLRGKGTGERALAAQLARSLDARMLVLADRDFYSYALYCRVRATGAQVLWRLCRGTVRLPVTRMLPDGSWISTVTDPAAAARQAKANEQRRRRGSKTPPDTSPLPGITVRVIAFTITVTSEDGTRRAEPYLLITSLTDHRACPARELAALYAWRWAIETGYRECKTYLRGPGRVLRGRSPVLARQELWALLAVYQAIRILIVRAAARDGLDPDRISFTTALHAITRRMTAASDHRPALDLIETEILAAAALVPQRPGRICLRAVRPARSPYPSRNTATGLIAQHATYHITLTPAAHTTPNPRNQHKHTPHQPPAPP
jgi:hypothetical protein